MVGSEVEQVVMPMDGWMDGWHIISCVFCPLGWSSGLFVFCHIYIFPFFSTRDTYYI